MLGLEWISTCHPDRLTSQTQNWNLSILGHNPWLGGVSDQLVVGTPSGGFLWGCLCMCQILMPLHSKYFLFQVQHVCPGSMAQESSGRLPHHVTMLLVLPFYWWRSWGWWRISNLFNVTCLGSEFKSLWFQSPSLEIGLFLTTPPGCTAKPHVLVSLAVRWGQETRVLANGICLLLPGLACGHCL